MSYLFTADEILQMAIEIERTGAAFYRSAAENISDSDNKKLLVQLAEMEDDHEKTFQSMKADLTKAEKTQTTFDPENESAQYLRALADTKVFYQKEIDLSSMKEIMKAAITAEKDSIVFYLGMKDLVPAKLGQAKIDNIIQEEMGHIRLLSKVLLSIKT
ncbi:MAG: ferritin-like domain-containing protein [Candidatus Helarchaeota archaeon]